MRSYLHPDVLKYDGRRPEPPYPTENETGTMTDPQSMEGVERWVRMPGARVVRSVATAHKAHPQSGSGFEIACGLRKRKGLPLLDYDTPEAPTTDRRCKTCLRVEAAHRRTRP